MMPNIPDEEQRAHLGTLPGEIPAGMELTNCIVCGRSFHIWPDIENDGYCSDKCARADS